MSEGGSKGARQRPSPAKLYGLIGLMVLLWSANFVVAKFALRDFPPLLLSGIRTTLAGLFILPVFFWDWKRRPRPDVRQDLGLLALLGIVGVGFNQVLFIYGLSRTSVSHSAILIGLTPALVLLMAAFAGQERLARHKFVGMGLALAGVATLSLAPGKSGGATFLGDANIVLGSLAFSWFTVYGKRATTKYGAVLVSTAAYVGAALALAPVTLLTAARHNIGSISFAGWVSVFYMALFPSMVCYLIYSYALSHIPASRVSMVSYVQPLLAMLIAMPVLGERLTGGLFTGGALVLAGVWITERS